MNFELFTDVALAVDVPEYRLRRGDVVKIVDRHTAPDGEIGHSVEVLNALGDALKVVVLPASTLEPLREDEILCARAF